MKEAKEWTLDTPGMHFGLALDYYRVEAFATERDRDAACGPTAHKDVRYVPTSRNDLAQGGTTLDQIACGHSIDHPQFDKVFKPIFEAALQRLVDDAIKAPKGQTGDIASTTIAIARARYTISAVRAGDWLTFPVSGLAVFEEVEQDLIDRTVTHLQGRMMLEISPAIIDAEPN